MGEEAGRIDSGRSEGCWKFFKGSRRGVGRVGMTGLKKCDAFFLIGGGAAAVISQRTWTESSVFGSPSSVVGTLFQTRMPPYRYIFRVSTRSESSVVGGEAPRDSTRIAYVSFADLHARR